MVKSEKPVGPYVEGPRTVKLRPSHGFTREEVDFVRKLKKEGHEVEDIAKTVNADTHRVELALAALRTRRKNPDRSTINVGNAAADFIKGEQKGGEAMWQTVDKIITELQILRSKSKSGK